MDRSFIPVRSSMVAAPGKGAPIVFGRRKASEPEMPPDVFLRLDLLQSGGKLGGLTVWSRVGVSQTELIDCLRYVLDNFENGGAELIVSTDYGD